MKLTVILCLMLWAKGVQNSNFDTATAKCIIDLLYLDSIPKMKTSKTFEKTILLMLMAKFEVLKNNGMDFMITKLIKIRDSPADQLSFTDFNVSHFIKDINQFFLLFSSIKEKVNAAKLKECDLSRYKELVLRKCQVLYKGPCVPLENDPFTAVQEFPNSELYMSHAYYPKCPFEDGGSGPQAKPDKYRCKKQKSLILKPFASKVHCEASSSGALGAKCVELPQMIWVPECPPGFERVLNLLCISKCPPTWMNDRRNCQKLNSRRVRNSVVITFYDLITDYEVADD